MNRPKMEPHFTVIIPNKNRASYLAHTLRTCSSQEYDRLEVIVSDDASTEDTRAVVEEAASRDRRIRFVSHPEPIGMLENFERALSLARPGFVIALGGDDGLMPGGIAGMRDALEATGASLLTWAAPIFAYNGVRGGRGQLCMYRDRKSRMVESAQFLARQARNLNYLGDLECPMFYVKGVASTELVERVRRRSAGGGFYSCPTPDGYSGIVLAGETERFAYSGKPFSIYGQSPASQGLAYLSNSAQAKAASRQFFRAVAQRPMHADLASQPYSPLITLMTADYLLTCRDLPGWPGRVPEVDFRELIHKAVAELSHGLYGADRVRRELGILSNIARRHGLEDFMARRVARSRRYRDRAPFEGTGINRAMILLDAVDYSLTNIYDASVAAAALHRASLDLDLRAAATTLLRSARYKLSALRRGESFPPPREWSLDESEA